MSRRLLSDLAKKQRNPGDSDVSDTLREERLASSELPLPAKYSRACIELAGLGHAFNSRWVFENLSGVLRPGQIGVVTGCNGSGKSTVLRLIAGLIAPTNGSATVSIGGKSLDRFERRLYIGFVSSEPGLYGELTGVENLLFFGSLRGVQLEHAALRSLLERVGLRGRGSDLVSSYSTGMRQRLRYAAALLANPPILLLDEPTANLDAEGIAITREILAEKRRPELGGLAILATNDPREIEWGDSVFTLNARQ